MRESRSAPADQGFRARIGIALAAAVLLHVVAAFLAPGRASEPIETATLAQRVSIAERTPPPTPRPTPVPTPTPSATPPPHFATAPHVAVRNPAPKAAATPHLHAGGAAAHKRVVRVKPRPQRPAPPISLADATHAGQQNGGAGTGAGAGKGDAGLSGTGSGSGTAGTGNGGDADLAPCGDIYLLPGPTAFRKDGVVLQHVLAKIVFRDGTVEVDRFPYPFVYTGEKDNPFRHDADVSADGGIPVQEPPPNSDVTTFPASVQTVLKYTDPKTGVTTLPACNPSAAPH